MKLDFLKEQTQWVNDWTLKLISGIDEKDFRIVHSLKTSINWEVGHLIISKYFHAVQSIVNEQNEIIAALKQKIPIDDFYTYYFVGSNPIADWENRPNKIQLLEYNQEMDKATNQVIEKMNEKTLNEKTEINNPVARSKYEALAFAFKHQMWHNGQIAMIKRIAREES